MSPLTPCPLVGARYIPICNPYIAHSLGTGPMDIHFGDLRIFQVEAPRCEPNGNTSFPLVGQKGREVVLYSLKNREGKPQIWEIFDRTLPLGPTPETTH